MKNVFEAPEFKLLLLANEDVVTSSQMGLPGVDIEDRPDNDWD